MEEPVKSVIAKALAVACETCGAAIGDPCKQPDGAILEKKGHWGVHGARFMASRHISRGAS